LKAEGDLLGPAPPWSDLGETKRRERVAIELAATRKIADANADVVNDDPASWHVSGSVQ
jgi:hypothetical protein